MRKRKVGEDKFVICFYKIKMKVREKMEDRKIMEKLPKEEKVLGISLRTK